MIRGGAATLRLAQQFFEDHLRGLYQWGSVDLLARENSIPDPGRRRSVYGKYRETARVQFGLYLLTIESPLEHPPLGWATLDHPDGVDEGPLDAETWRKFGLTIQQQHMRTFDHDHRKPSAAARF